MRRSSRCIAAALGVGLLCALYGAGASTAWATDAGAAPADAGQAPSGPDSAVEPGPPRNSAEQSRRDAGAAYEQGDRAFASQDYAAAAEFYETADRLVPSPAAGVNAVRAHRGCHSPGHDARAATLSLRLLTRYPGDTRVTAYAYRVTDDLSPTLTRLQVRCQGCDLAIDQQSSEPNAYITPGHHVITGSWGERVVARDLDALAGSTVSVVLDPPMTEVPGTPAPTVPSRPALPAVTPAPSPAPSPTVSPGPVPPHAGPSALRFPTVRRASMRPSPWSLAGVHGRPPALTATNDPAPWRAVLGSI